ncbi:MAG: hypothetical protein Q4F81_06835 [Eubacteriales bacterium]|nr:hypothetical protein [Eubacteriales bacterium]
MKRGSMALLVGVLALGLSLPVGASEMRGTVEVRLDAGELPVTNGAVTMYLVGVPTEGGYRLLDSYGGGIVRGEDACSGNLAYWLGELAGSGKELLLDVDGRVVFSGIEEGLYLLVQTQRMDGFYPFRSFLVEVPAQGQWTRCYEPVIMPITDEPPLTGDLGIYLAVLGMALSGGGLVCCGIWNRKKKG